MNTQKTIHIYTRVGIQTNEDDDATTGHNHNGRATNVEVKSRTQGVNRRENIKNKLDAKDLKRPGTEGEEADSYYLRDKYNWSILPQDT